MKLNSFNLLLLLAILASVSAVVVQRYLPLKERVAVPVTAGMNSWLYLSKPENSETTDTWLDQQHLKWRCSSSGKDEWLVCNMTLQLTSDPAKGWDLSSFSKMQIHLEYHGPVDKIRVAFRNYDKRYSTPQDANSSKFLSATLWKNDLNKDASIGLNEFKVADWWIDQFSIPRSMAGPDLNNVVAVSIEFSGMLPPGDHDVALEHLSFTGDLISRDYWYLGILGLWLMGSLVILLVRVWKLYQQTQQAQARIGELAHTNVRLESENSELQTLSHQDALTGISNRHAIDQAIADWLPTREGESLALILIDIDHFKRVNDRRGHAVGDQVLQQFAQIIAENIRSNDVFGRWGGEEFILLCPKTDINSAFRLAEKIRVIISDTTFEKAKPLAITASFGVGTILPGEAFGDAFTRVDQALYQAKAVGRNCAILAEVNATPTSKHD